VKLPEIANRLRELAVELNCPELNELANEMGRRPAGQRAPKSSVPMTDALRDQIREMKRANPSLSHAEIASKLRVNPGRVSETLRGKRS
jgi:hypothetical protein